MSENTTNQITLTAEQLVNIVGHAATQEQLDNVRRELDAKIDKLDERLSAKIERVDGKIDTLKNWMLGMGFTVLVSAVAATAFIVSRLPPQ
ncbi:hypothetical protein [Shewanella colwelliana]|uniref:hypothetical protein n=1 Tax=Shewanella colwelliana TaxID=23 RepID=UPI00373554C3